MQTMLPVAPTIPAVSDFTPRTDSVHAEPAEEVSVPFYRSLFVRIYVGAVYCMSVFEYMKVSETATHHEPLWVYALLVLFFPLVMVVWLPLEREITIRYPFVRPERTRALKAHGLAFVGLTLFGLGFRSVFTHFSPLPLPAISDPNWWLLLLSNAFGYVLTAALFEVARATRRYRALEVARAALGVRVAEARRRRTEAELRALKAELNPHFLGNALASVMALLATDVRAADRALAKIGELLGRLGRRSAHEVTLVEELEELEPVLEYERLRLSGRLTVERDLADDTADALVPDMILQPLVENAVKYGLAPRGGGTLKLGARRTGTRGETLVISVRDCGLCDAPAGTTPSHGTGVGLANVRSRLRELYGADAQLELRPEGARGTVALLTLPWRDETSPAAQPKAGDDEELGGGSRSLAKAGRHALLRQRIRWLAGSAVRIALVVVIWALYANWIANGNAQSAIERKLRPDLFGIGLDVAWTAALRLAAGITALEVWRRLSGRWSSTALLRLHFAVPFGLGVLGILEKVTFITMRAPERMRAMPWSHLVFNMVNEIKSNYVIYFAVLGLAVAVQALRRTRWSHASRLRLHQRLEEERQGRAAAELRALQAELNPHFVGNALTVVSSLIHTDRAAAMRVLEELGTLLRAALSRAATHEVTLREEIATLKSFLAVEHARLGRRLDIHWEVDERALDGQVPHMILQPLLENAVKHGLAPRGQAGRIDVEARRGERELELVVRDDGVGLSLDCDTHTNGRKGVGLANTRARLSELYGPIAQLELSRGESGGTVARVRIPWHSEMDSGLVAASAVVVPSAIGRPAHLVA
jgi:two-component system LytT family sensor kinase